MGTLSSPITHRRSERASRLIEQHLGIPGKYGAWWTGRRLLQEVWKKRPSVLRDATFDLRDLPFNEVTGDIGWIAQWGRHMIGMVVHHYDKNSQYLSACRAVYSGCGDPIHLTENIVPGLPGIYRLASVSCGESVFDGRRFPSIIEPGDEWVTNDVLVFAQSHGYTFAISEAWVFEESAKVTDKWAKTLWDARQSLKHIDEEAYHTIKAIATKGLGAFATNREKHPGLDLIHPNWYFDGVGKARVNMLANFLKYGAPDLVETDGVWYVKRDPNPRTAVPGILDRMRELGGYKHESSFVLTEEIYAQLQGKTFGAFVAFLKHCGGER